MASAAEDFGEDGGKTGRPRGTRNAKTVKMQQAMLDASEALNRAFDPDFDDPEDAPFVGDALQFLVAVYKSGKVPLDMRVEAAKTAVKYQHSALTSQDAAGDKSGVVNIIMLPSDADL